MDGRQIYGNYAGNMSGPGYYNPMGYGRGHNGMPVPYNPGPSVMPQQMGATIPGLNSYSSQPSLHFAEDPSLYVNFDEEDEEFATSRRVDVSFDQQPARKPAAAVMAQPPATSRLRQATNSAALPQSRPGSAAGVKAASATAADQELENLRRRIAEKERQIKAQRQSAQGNAGANNAARINPALGPVLRGLHRKQSPVVEDTTKQVDAFLKEIAAGVSSKAAGEVPPQATAQTAPQAKTAPLTKQAAQVTSTAANHVAAKANKARLDSAKQSVKPSLVAPAPKTQPGASSARGQQQTKQAAPLKVAQPLSKSPSKPTQTAGNRSSQASQAVAKDKKATPKPKPSKAVGDSGAAQKLAETAKLPAQPSAQLSKTVAEPARLSSAALHASPQQPNQLQARQPAAAAQQAPKSKQPSVADQQPRDQPRKAVNADVPAPVMEPSQVDDLQTDDTKARQRQPSEGASDSDLGGVAVQSGYHMSDSPVLLTTSEDEEQLPVESTSAPPVKSVVASASQPIVVPKASIGQAAGTMDPPPPPQPALLADSNADAGMSSSPAPKAEKPTAAGKFPPTSSRIASAHAANSPPAKQPASGQNLTEAAQKAGPPGATTMNSKPAPLSKEIVTTQQAEAPEALAKQQVPSKVSAGQKQSVPSSMQLRQQSSPAVASSQGQHKAHKAIVYPTTSTAGTPVLTDDKPIVPGLRGKASPRTALAVAPKETAHDVTSNGKLRGAEQAKQIKPTAGLKVPATSASKAVKQVPAKVSKVSTTGQEPYKAVRGTQAPALSVQPAPVLDKAADHSNTTAAVKPASMTVSTPNQRIARPTPAPGHTDSGPLLQNAAASPMVPFNTQANASGGQPHQAKVAAGKVREFQAAAEPSRLKGHPAAPAQQLIPSKTPPTSYACASLAPPALPASSSAAQLSAAADSEALMKATADPNPPLPPSDSGESMDIDEEDERQTPPLPQEEVDPEMLQLATIDSNGSDTQLAESADAHQLKLNRLSRIQARKQELCAVKQYLNDMMFQAKHEYLALRFEEQQIELTGGSTSGLALPDAPADQLPLALPPPEGSSQDPSSASQGGRRQTQRANELQSRTELNKARTAALQAMPRQAGSTPLLSKKSVQTGLTPEVQKALLSLHAVEAQPSAASGDKQSSAVPGVGATPPLQSHTSDRSAARLATVSAEAKLMGQQAAAAAPKLQGSTARTAGDDRPAPAAKSTAGAQKSQAPSDRAGKALDYQKDKVVERQLDRQHSRRGRDHSADPQPNTSRQAAKRKRSRSRSRSTARRADRLVSKGRSDAARRPSSVSRQRTTRSRSRSPASKRSRQPRGYTDRRRSPSSSISPELKRRQGASDTPRQRQRSDRKSPVPTKRRRTPSPRGPRRTNSPARQPSPAKQESSRSRPGSAQNHSKVRSPVRGTSRTARDTSRTDRSPASRLGSSKSSPVHEQAPSRRQASTSRSSSPPQQVKASRQPETKAQQHSHSVAATGKVSLLKAQVQTRPVAANAAPGKEPSPRLAQQNSLSVAAHAAPAEALSSPEAQQQSQSLAANPAPVAAAKLSSPEQSQRERQPAVANSIVSKEALYSKQSSGTAGPVPDQSASVKISNTPSAAHAGALTKGTPLEQTGASAAAGAENLRKEQDAAVPSQSVSEPPVAQQAQPSTTVPQLKPASDTTSARPQAANCTEVVDITADDTDNSHISVDAGLHPVASASTAEAEASFDADVPMAEADQSEDPLPHADAAEAFISLELDDATTSKAVPVRESTEPASAARPNQAQQAAPSTIKLSQQSVAAVPVKDGPKQQGDQITSISTSGQGASEAAPTISRPASANALDAAAPLGPKQPLQKALPGGKARAPGKGGIQIVMATKHKEEVTKGRFPFPSIFGALFAQGLPGQGGISSEVLPAAPQAPSVANSPTISRHYLSPLQIFRSYRLSETYGTVSQLPLTSPSFSHRLDPHWPLCTYDIRGSCRDAKCPYQHASDYQLENVAVLRNLHSQAARAGARAPLPALPGGEITSAQMINLAKQIVSTVPQPQVTLPSSATSRLASPNPLRTQQRISKERRRQLATEDPIPIYSTHPSGTPSAESHAFKSQLLSSVAVEHEHMPWLLLSGWEGYESLMDFSTAPRTGTAAPDSTTGALSTRPGDKMTGRYYQDACQDTKASAHNRSEAKAPAAEAEGEREQLLAGLEQRVAAEPKHEELRILLALQHIDFGAINSLKGHKLMECVRNLAKGLEADSSFTRLWLLYLPLYHRHLLSKGDTHEATDAAKTCLSHSKHCYQLWLTAIQLQPTWQGRAIMIQRGIVALSRADAAQYQGLNADEVQGWACMRSGCVLDLALRLLLLWASADMHDLAAAWINDLAKLASLSTSSRASSEEDSLKLEEKALPAAARQALLQQVHRQPNNAAVLWLACAHFAAYNSLPDQAVHRLGFAQQPAVHKWQQAPPASCHTRVRGLLSTAAGSGFGCLALKSRPEIVDAASVATATQGAWPRQALALTIAHWELATQCTPLVHPSTAPSTSPPISPEAGSLLYLAHMTSKAYAHVLQPLRNQAMEAWQRATWPAGSCELLSIAMTAVAEAFLQAFIAEYSQPAAPDATHTSQHNAAPGRLQQLVIAAVGLLHGLAQAQKQFMSGLEADAEEDLGSPELSPSTSQPSRLQSAVVSVVATRAYQLSNGNAEVALAIMVAAALPEWGIITSRAAGYSPPWGHVALVANEHSQPPSNRKRARSDSSSPSHSSSLHRKQRHKRSSSSSSSSSSSESSASDSSDTFSSTSTSSSSDSATSHTSSRSSQSSGSESPSTAHGRSRRSPGQSSQGNQQASPDGPALHAGQTVGGRSVLADQWHAVEAAGSLGGLEAVRDAYMHRAETAEQSQSLQELEEGEIRAVDEDMKRTEACYRHLNGALYEALSRNCSQAAQALQAALHRAEGNCYLQAQIWREYLSLASAVLVPESDAPAAVAIAQQLHGVLQPERLRQRLQLWQQYSAWQQLQAMLSPLALPQLPYKDKRVKALVEQLKVQDGEEFKDGCLALLANASPVEEQALVEAWSSGTPSSAAKAQLLLDLAARKPQDAQYAAWILPLAAAQLLNAAPCAAPHLWLQAVVLAERHSTAAALELCTVAVGRHPFSAPLYKRQTALRISAQSASAAST